MDSKAPKPEDIDEEDDDVPGISDFSLALRFFSILFIPFNPLHNNFQFFVDGELVN